MDATQCLPAWNLDDLYKGKDDPQIHKDLTRLQAQIETFQSQHEGHLEGISGSKMCAAMIQYQSMDEVIGRLMSFAFLQFAENMENKENGLFYQTIKEKITTLSTKLIFFTLEINDFSDDYLNCLFDDSEALRHFKPWFDNVRAFRPHQLSKEIEKLLHEKSVTSKANWVRLFEETFASLRFDVGDAKGLPAGDVMNLFSSPDKDVRAQAACAFSKGMKDHISIFSLITNTLAKDKEIGDTWRGFARPISSKNLENQVEDEVVDALISSVKKAYPQLSHKYYALKAKWLGVEKLNYWDRNAPLPMADGKLRSWHEGRDIVLGAYRDFSPTLAEIGQRFFDKNWIDARVQAGKDSGAFSHPTVPSVHPYILMNYYGKNRDIMTLAHELGHGVHQVLSSKQGYLLSDTPLTIAETASVFGEMLTFQALLRGAKTDDEKKVLLAGKVEDMLNTVVRQVAFSEFERQVHDLRREGEISVEKLGAIWMETQRASLGPIFDLHEEDYKYFWAYIPHFIHTPFYVYAYAFGDCLVNSLYASYQDGMPDFEKKYIKMLEAGGTLRHKDLLAPFGLDAGQPEFWNRGLHMIHKFIDELERLG